jgi:16S rRNA processing protein RimM
LKGEVRIELLLDAEGIFDAGSQVILSRAGFARATEIEFVRSQHGHHVAKFRGIDSISEAEKYVGAEVKVQADFLPAPKAGWFYTFQLKGCSVVTTTGEAIGSVADVLDPGGTEILKVDVDQVEVLIPFAERYVKKIDLELKTIIVDLPEDLRYLNK